MSSQSASKSARVRRVLSIDGGGIRGIIPAHVIAHLEAISGQPAAQLFDLYDIQARQTVFLKSWHAAHAAIPMQEAARATAAAPTYFEPAEVSWGGQARPLIDGGIFLNSPVVSAYAEAIKRFPGDEIHVLSLGTGELTRPISFEQAQAWGALGWVLPLIDCMFDGMAKAADYQMRLFLGDRYQRIQAVLDIASDDMDDVSAENMINLERTAQRLIKNHQDALRSFLRA